MTADDRRPDPDALLAAAQAEEAEARRGKLKIFFGASPGVGKTFAMLLEARRLRAEGLDVVVGLAETHGRMETAALLEGLELLPRRAVDYRGRVLEEFDLDGALKRRPAMLLVDELAHTNAAGSRHPKRWQDVEELIAAGIDVLTTVNVQHIESLNDIVGGITGIRVAETVPDHVFERANEVVLIDLPPDDLLLRLREGKVYIAEQAERAIQNFFRKGNLIALRELALRQTADRVDDQMRAFRSASAETRVWNTRETLLVAVGPSDVDEKVVRTAARLAARLDIGWHAVYAETPVLQALPEQQRRSILRTLRLAQDLGAQTATIATQDAVQGILEYARRNNLARIVTGRSTRGRRPWRRPFSERLGARAPDIDLVTVARDEEGARDTHDAGSAYVPRESETRQRLQDAGFALLVCAGITLLATPLRHHIDLANIVMLYLLGVVVVAYRCGRMAAVVSAVASVISFDLFFVPPRLSFAVSDVQYLMTFAVMLAVGLVTGHLTSGLRFQARVANYREERAHSLYEMARSLSSSLVEEQVVEIADRFVAANFRAKVAVVLPDAEDRLREPFAHGAMPICDRDVAQWSYDRNEPAGAGTGTLPALAQLYLPLKAPMRVRGVLVIEPSNPRLLMIPEQRRLLDTFAALVAIALERIHFVTVAQDTIVRMESEKLRNTLLAALSHDLRTPLTALVGLAETLALDLAATESAHADRAEVIREQALRTSRLVGNLLEMARLQSGELKPRKDWQSVEEIVGSAIAHLGPLFARRALDLDLPADLPLVRCDAQMIERVLANLLENAVKYAPAEARIGIRAWVDPGARELDIEVWDEGPGLPAGQELAVFERFARGEKESAVPGVGLGLAICEAVVRAHGGHIRAELREPRGVRFVFTLPLEAQPGLEQEQGSQ